MWVLAEQLKWCRRTARRDRGVLAVPGIVSCLSPLVFVVVSFGAGI